MNSDILSAKIQIPSFSQKSILIFFTAKIQFPRFVQKLILMF